MKYIALILLLLAACSTAPQEIESDVDETQANLCITDADCLPCGENCIHRDLAPVTLCLEATHDDCACVNSVCVRG